MRIAFIVPMLKISGGIGVALYYAQKLAEEGHIVDVLNLDGNEFDHWYPAQSVNIINCSDPTKYNEFLRHDYDVAVGTLWSTIHQIRTGIVKSRKIVYLIQGDEENFYPLEREDLRSAVRETYIGDELKVVVSPWLQRQLQKRYPHESFHNITNGVDTAKFRSAVPFMPKGKKLRVMVEGAISSPAKRVRETLDLLRTVENIETWLISPVRGELFGIYPDVSLFEIPYSEMPSMYRSCDVLVKNSQTEGFALPVIEMMAAGGVPIVNDYGAQEDYIRHRVNGLIIPEMSEDNLLSSLNFVISNFESLSNEAKKTAHQLEWREQHLALLALIESHPNTNSLHRTRPAFMRRNWFDRETQSVSFQGPRMSSVARNEVFGMRGWVAKEGGGDIRGLVFRMNGEATPLSANVDRQDVAQHFGQEGTYGFALNLFPEEGQEFEIVNERDEVMLKANVPAASEMPYRYDTAGLVFTCESYPRKDWILYDFSQSATLRSLDIQLKPGGKISVDGVEVGGSAFRATEGVVSVRMDDVISITEKRQL